jgi:23S rRNA pseudouridine955/2504/2580 synthase
MKEIIIGSNEKDQRLDRFLMKYLNDSTRGNIFKLLRKKVIKVNGGKKDPEYFLAEGDVLQIYLADETMNTLMKEERVFESEELDLDIVYEDEEILIVDKPYGLLTHPDQTEYSNTLSTKVLKYLKAYSTRTFKPASIQRLDKNTSGLVIFCKTYDALKQYNEWMRDRKIDKYYIAVVHGVMSETQEIKGFLVKDSEVNKVSIHEEELPDSKAVNTLIKPLETKRGFTLVEIQLFTGRSHQIRASLELIDHSIVGDVKYGGRRLLGATTQLLHAYKVVVDSKVYTSQKNRVFDFWNTL